MYFCIVGKSTSKSELNSDGDGKSSAAAYPQRVSSNNFFYTNFTDERILRILYFTEISLLNKFQIF